MRNPVFIFFAVLTGLCFGSAFYTTLGFEVVSILCAAGAVCAVIAMVEFNP